VFWYSAPRPASIEVSLGASIQRHSASLSIGNPHLLAGTNLEASRSYRPISLLGLKQPEDKKINDLEEDQNDDDPLEFTAFAVVHDVFE